ncbi:LphB [Legionella gratiana]|uniref:LphB n=1 Tax=Legionella gratiana TaxID=45066 RepID=A0A378J674_9GAMM|nr:protein LphB [Legionella gratiana]KTD06222.1 LphB [Legionella gratiana]STX43115.1 LphB [Legionella gratiana]
MKSELRWYDCIFIVLFFYLLILQIQAIWPFTIDDMYISLRYSRHWVAGNGLLWNVQAPPVEGYSNFLFVALGALTLLLKGNPIIVLKIAGLIGLYFTCYFIYLISRFWFSKRKSLLPCLGLLLYKGQIIWAISGLETAVYQAFICGTVYFCFRGMGYQLFPHSRSKSENIYFIFAGLFLALAGMTRPEAPALMILFFILLCWDRPQKEIKHYWQGVFLFCAALALFYGPYFLWRLTYFGFLFPNSVYCKGLSNVFTLTLDRNYLKLIWPFALLALPACSMSEGKRHYFLWLPSVLYLIMLVNSDPIVAFDNRLFLPAFALLLPLALLGISTLVDAFWQKRDFVFNTLFYLIYFTVVFFFIPKMSLSDYRYFYQNPIRGEQLRIKVVDWLNSHVAFGASVVLADCGLIPYLSHLNFIDSYCLNNLTMAHYPEKLRYELFCNTILHKKPEVIILTSLIEQRKVIYTPSDVCLKKLLNKQNKYTLSQIYMTNNSDSIYRYEIYTNSSVISPISQ